MKLMYQWLIILALSGILWVIHTYGGAGCSKPLPSHPHIPALKIVVQRKASVSLETSNSIQKNSVPKIPSTPPSKSQKRRERRKTAKIKKQSDNVSEWDFCEDTDIKMIQ